MRGRKILIHWWRPPLTFAPRQLRNSAVLLHLGEALLVRADVKLALACIVLAPPRRRCDGEDKSSEW